MESQTGMQKWSDLLDSICDNFHSERAVLTDLCFLDFLSGFAYNKLELLWITIATYR
jgi:hypothetical protein